MKQGFTVVKKHGSDRWEVALGPDSQNREHRNFFRTRKRARADAQFSHIAYLEEINSVRLDRLVARKVIAPENSKPAFAPIQPPPQGAPKPSLPPQKPKGFFKKAAPVRKPQTMLESRIRQGE